MIMIAIANLPFIFKKELKELKLVVICIFFAVNIILVIGLIELVTSKIDETSQTHIFLSNLMRMQNDFTSVKSVSILLVAFTFQSNMFPVFN